CYVCPLGKVLKTMLPAGVRKSTKVKQQYFVSNMKAPKEMREICIELREKAPQQAAILDQMLLAKKGMLLSELLEASSAQASSVKSLATKGILHLELVRPDRLPLTEEEYFKTEPKVLREEQKLALEAISETLSKNIFETHLLHGITGSGKTEVYLQAVDKALQLGRGVILLVPEIALTTQTIQHFKSRFDEPVAVLHHRLSDGERLDTWEKLRSGELRICLGARSAIFCPMQNIGLIIVDEEHEQSYKQSDDSPCYSGRDVAIMRAKINNCCIVLGSATPSMESYYNASSGKYQISVLSERPEGSFLPTVTVVDMKREFDKAKGFTLFSDTLLTKIDQRRARGEHTILFLNRRGYHTVLSCISCGKSVGCPHCDAPLTFHMSDQLLACHLCGLRQHPPRRCPSCQSEQVMKYRGIGTEKVEAMLGGIFPGLRTMRIDADTTRHKGAMCKLIQEFRSGKADVLIGTQMVAKGLHFPQVTLVGVLNADSAMNIPDFRSQESTFQLITQVAGRAGRGLMPGEVIIQTSLPEQSTIQQAAKQDYIAFYREEIEVRKAFNFPPFCRIVKFQFSSKDEKRVQQAACAYAEAIAKELAPNFHCHPAVPSGHARVKELYRYQFLVRGPSVSHIVQAIDKVDAKLSLPSGVFRFIDVDPSSTFF
ncbi:MAG: primosomal protein N', partial [Verrucomicrobia bacterium]|nr:primosomal protein N' [Verrucomicrobiota bacterium]